MKKKKEKEKTETNPLEKTHGRRYLAKICPGRRLFSFIKENKETNKQNTTLQASIPLALYFFCTGISETKTNTFINYTNTKSLANNKTHESTIPTDHVDKGDARVFDKTLYPCGKFRPV